MFRLCEEQLTPNLIGEFHIHIYFSPKIPI